VDRGCAAVSTGREVARNRARRGLSCILAVCVQILGIRYTGVVLLEKEFSLLSGYEGLRIAIYYY